MEVAHPSAFVLDDFNSLAKPAVDIERLMKAIQGPKVMGAVMSREIECASNLLTKGLNKCAGIVYRVDTQQEDVAVLTEFCSSVFSLSPSTSQISPQLVEKSSKHHCSIVLPPITDNCEHIGHVTVDDYIAQLKGFDTIVWLGDHTEQMPEEGMPEFRRLCEYLCTAAKASKVRVIAGKSVGGVLHQMGLLNNEVVVTTGATAFAQILAGIDDPCIAALDFA